MSPATLPRVAAGPAIAIAEGAGGCPDRYGNNPPVPFFFMNGTAERRIIYVMCLVVLGLGLFVLSRTLNQGDPKSVGVSLALIAVSVVTAVAASRSGQLSGTIDDEIMSEADLQ